MNQESQWWQEAVVYQVYPRSFQDSDGDGIGDLRGIIQRLDYLHQLGITAIWLSPVYKSPNDDNGYDISDYEDIMEEFGTMQEMDELIQQARALDIRIIMDLVVNHTSDEHAWFKEARKSLDNPYRDFYIWRSPAADGGVPNDLKSTFSGSAWEWDAATEEYFLHLFSKRQPDLNWENAQVRAKIYEMMNFWLDKGIGGFRMDVIDLIGKLPDQKITGNGPKLHTYLKEMAAATFLSHDVMTVGETWGATPEIAKLYSDPDRKELSMVFQFEHSGLDQQAGKEKWDLKPLVVAELKAVLSKWQTSLGTEGWNSLFWNNHDLPRIISRWGNDKEYRVESGKMLAILLHLMKGTPYIYQGEEIGMTNCPVKSVDEINDIESLNLYAERLEEGYTEDEILVSINTKGRDNARTPMQWSAAPEAGFTTGTPWLHVNPNYTEINVAACLADPDSLFYTYQKLIALRKNNPLIIWGDYQLELATAAEVFSYTRSFAGETWRVVANFSAEPQVYALKDAPREFVIGNYPEKNYQQGALQLAPYETFVVKV